MSTSKGDTLVLIPGIYRSGVNSNETAFLMVYQNFEKLNLGASGPAIRLFLAKRNSIYHFIR